MLELQSERVELSLNRIRIVRGGRVLEHGEDSSALGLAFFCDDAVGVDSAGRGGGKALL